MTSWIAAIIRRPRTMVMFMFLVFLFGLLTYINIPKDAQPDIDIPVFVISVPYKGVSPEDGVDLLVRPLERQLRSLEGLKRLSAVASEGHASIVLEFDISFDKDQALLDVRDKIDRAKSDLPDDLEDPVVNEINFSLVPTIVIALSGDVPERILHRHAVELKEAIQTIPTVLEANLTGNRDEILEVLIDNDKLEGLNYAIDQLPRTLRSNNAIIAAGAFDNGEGRFKLKVPGLLKTNEELSELVIMSTDENVIKLRDIADIRRTFEDAKSYTRVNGQPAIAIDVVKRLGTNIIENNQAVRDLTHKISADWNSAIKVNFMVDQSSFIGEVIGSLESSVITAIVLVMFVVILAMGMRSSLLVGVSIPLSFLTGFLILNTVGITVNMMVMFGLVITVGMLVDGTIVIVEYADRKISEGLERQEAYIRAMQMMFWPVVSSTATTLVAFLPMLAWPGVAGEFMSYLPIMIIIVLSASLMTALVFLPVLGSLIGRRATAAELANSTAQTLSGREGNIDDFTGFTRAYVRMLQHFFKTPLIPVFGILSIVFSLFLYLFIVGNDVEFFIEEEPDQALVFVSARGNLSPSRINEIMKKVEAGILGTKGISNIYMQTGQGATGSPMGNNEDIPPDMIGQFTLEFEDFAIRRQASEISAEIDAKIQKIPGIHVEIRKVQGGPPTGKDINLEIYSHNPLDLTPAVAKIRAFAENEMEHVFNLEDTRPLPGIEWQIEVDRDVAGHFNVGLDRIGNYIKLVTEGLNVGAYRPNDSTEEIEIRVRMPEHERDLEALNQIKISTAQGLIPLSTFISIKPAHQVPSLLRADGRYRMSFKASVDKENANVTRKVNELDEWIKSQEWSPRLSFAFKGADEEQQEAGQFLLQAAVAVMFLMFIILLTQFNSFYQAILTLMTVVLAMGGVILGMIITGQSFSIIMSGTGIVALAGIVVNNAIVLIDTFNRLKKEINDLELVALKTAAQRLRPILLTTITTIAGLIPMALQISVDFFTPQINVGSITSMWWVQLSTAIIFGLAFSTIITLILVPIMLAQQEKIKAGFIRTGSYIKCQTEIFLRFLWASYRIWRNQQN